MSASFRDIEAWETLSDTGADAEALREALEALAGAKPGERAVFRGYLMRLAAHADERVRALSLRGLCGLAGHAGFERVHPRLSDPAPVVRQAALALFENLLPLDPAKWVLALFHPLAEIRRAAAAFSHKDLREDWRLHCLEDPGMRPVILERLADAKPTEAFLRGLLRASVAGWLGREELRPFFDASNEDAWGNSLAKMVPKVGRFAGPKREDFARCGTIAEISFKVSEGIEAEAPLLVALIDQLCGAGADGGAREFLLRILWKHRRLPSPPHGIVHCIVADRAWRQVVAAGGPSPEELAFFFSLCPDLLACPALPADLVRAALIRIRPARESMFTRTRSPADLAALVDFLRAEAGGKAVFPPFADGAGGLSLPALHGLLGLGLPVGDFDLWEWVDGWLGTATLVEAMAREVETAAHFLSDHIFADSENFRLAWILEFTRLHPEKAPDLLAGCFALRYRRRKEVAEALEREPLKRTLAALGPRLSEESAFLAAEGHQIVRQCLERLAKLVGTDHLLRQLCPFLEDLPPYFVDRLVETVADIAEAEAWLADCTALEEDALFAVLASVDRCPHFPTGKILVLLHGLPPRGERWAAWAAARAPEEKESDGPPPRTIETLPPGAALPNDLLTVARRRWQSERFVLAFGEELLRTGRKLPEVLASVLGDTPENRTDIWEAAEHLHGIWRSRPEHAREAYTQLHNDAFAAVLLSGLDDPHTAPAAAKILRRIHWIRQHPHILRACANPVTGRLPFLSAEVREILRPWISSEGLPGASAPKAADAADATEAAAVDIAACTDPDRLILVCRANDQPRAEAAMKRLLTLGTAAAGAVSALFQSVPGPPHLPALAAVAGSWPDSAATAFLRRQTILKNFPDHALFLLARAFLEAGPAEPGLPEALVHSLLDSLDAFHLSDEDSERLQRLPVDPLAFAMAAVVSPHPQVYLPCLKRLMAAPCDPPLAAALENFLRCGTARFDQARIQVAAHLLKAGCAAGLPVILAEWLEKEGADAGRVPIFGSTVLASMDDAAVEDFVEGLLLAEGSHRSLLRDVFKGLQTDRARAALTHRLLQRAVATCRNGGLRGDLLEQLRAHMPASPFLQPLARTFVEGEDIALRLLGRRFDIQLLFEEGDFGYTNLERDVVYVTPLPLIRGEAGGREIVRGLIVHELGHHVYNRGAEAAAVMEEARKEKIFHLLNLVADEHLERNLRAMDEGFGNDFKLLAAYAFQRAPRSLHVYALFELLGKRTYATLTRCPLAPSRDTGCILVNSGRLMEAAETGGAVFPRFMRALRMGLGNRSGDPRIGEALRLFRGPRFRSADMPRLLEIARELRRIFGEEADEWAERLSPEALAAGNGPEVENKAPGLDGEAMKEAIRRLKEDRARSGRRSPAMGTGKVANEAPEEGDPEKFLNLGEETDFSRISRIEPLPYTPETYQALARKVRFEAARLRPFFENIGVRQVSVGGRTRGHRLDSSRLLGLLTRRDPHILRTRVRKRLNALYLGVLVDCSSSMTMDGHIERAKAFAALIAEATRGLPGIESRFWGFTDSVIYDAGTARRCAAAELEASGGNNDAAALWHAARAALASRHPTRLLVMISDGSPTECSSNALRALVRNLTRRHRIGCLQVAVAPMEAICFPHFVDISQTGPRESVRAFGQLIVHRVRALMGG